MCEKFGCLPSALYKEDVELLSLLAIVERGTPPEDYGDPDMEEEA